MDAASLTKKRPRIPTLPGNGRTTFWRTYDEEGDLLLVLFASPTTFAYTSPIDDYTAYRVAMETGEVIGLEVESFFARAVAKYPELRALAEVTTPMRWTMVDPTNSEAAGVHRLIVDVLASRGIRAAQSRAAD